MQLITLYIYIYCTSHEHNLLYSPYMFYLSFNVNCIIALSHNSQRNEKLLTFPSKLIFNSFIRSLFIFLQNCTLAGQIQKGVARERVRGRGGDCQQFVKWFFAGECRRRRWRGAQIVEQCWKLCKYNGHSKSTREGEVERGVKAGDREGVRAR